MNKYSHIFFNDLHFQIIEQIKKFNDKEVEPNGLEWERVGSVPNHIIKKLGQLGYLGIRYPKKYGGLELDLKLESDPQHLFGHAPHKLEV